MCIFEYNEEAVIADIRQDEFRLGHEQGLAQGISQGYENIQQLTNRLQQLNRTEDIIRMITDADYRAELLQEFNI